MVQSAQLTNLKDFGLIRPKIDYLQNLDDSYIQRANSIQLTNLAGPIYGNMTIETLQP